MIGIDDQDETERCQKRSDRHDPMSAVAVNQAADARRHQTCGEQRDRKAAHGKAHRPATLVRDRTVKTGG